MRLAVTSDLHFDFGGALTSPEKVEELVLLIVESKPDAVVLAGDIAAGFAAFEGCLAEFKGLGMPVGVLAGNHDLWRDDKLLLSTEALWGGALEEAADRIEEVQQMWMQMTGILESVSSDEITTYYIHQLWSSVYGVTRKRDLFRQVRSRITSKQSAIDLVKQMTAAFEAA